MELIVELKEAEPKLSKCSANRGRGANYNQNEASYWYASELTGMNITCGGMYVVLILDRCLFFSKWLEVVEYKAAP
jgi:hypothetical protein